MDGSTFDRLARVVGSPGSRRQMLGVLTGLGLGGLLAGLGMDEAGAEKPKDRLSRRTKQRRRKRRNEQRRNHKHGNSGGGGGLGSGQCVATGGDCTQDSDCCTDNCFNFECAEIVHQCSAGGTTIPCRPPAKGCVGDRCCHGSLSCDDGCCSEAANQCNPAGDCCTPNCDGRQCGDDGCGNGETCGSCPGNARCNASTGQCQGTVPCSPQTCPTGCCDQGVCQPGGSVQACGTAGKACVSCPNAHQVCHQGACCTPGTCETGQCGSISDGCGGTLNCGVCGAGQTCCDGECCQADQTCCGGECCPNAQACCVGECCPEGQVCCGDECASLQNDPENCGSCDNTCAPGQVCNQGNCCTPATCPPGFCGTMSDGCGNELTCSCPTGQDCCSGVCKDLLNDFDNCGVCGHRCAAEICQCNSCSNGECCEGTFCICDPNQIRCNPNNLASCCDCSPEGYCKD